MSGSTMNSQGPRLVVEGIIYVHAHIFAYRLIGILGRSLPQGDRAGIENAIARGLENMGK